MFDTKEHLYKRCYGQALLLLKICEYSKERMIALLDHDSL